MPAVLTRPALLDEKQAAEYLNVSTQTLSNWRCTGRYKLPFIRIGRAIRYRLDHLEKWLASRTEGAVH
jgi:excisionase family DNA binding protein